LNNLSEKALKAFLTGIGGTFLETVLSIMEKGEFQEISLPIEGGEEVIGEMTVFQKALNNFLFQRTKEANDIISQINGMEKNENGTKTYSVL